MKPQIFGFVALILLVTVRPLKASDDGINHDLDGSLYTDMEDVAENEIVVVTEDDFATTALPNNWDNDDHHVASTIDVFTERDYETATVVSTTAHLDGFETEENKFATIDNNLVDVDSMNLTEGNGKVVDDWYKMEGSVAEVKGSKIIKFWKWMYSLSGQDDNIIGRCFGMARKLKFIMPLIIFKLGVIITTLAFLVIFALKSLGIGVLLLVLNVGGLFAKLSVLKGAAKEQHQNLVHSPQYIPIPISPAPASQSPPQTVHFHVHKDSDGHHKIQHHGNYYEHSPATTGWEDRMSTVLGSTNDIDEKLELLALYKRLGFNIDRYLSKQH